MQQDNHFSPGKTPWYALHRRLGEPENHSGHSCAEKITSPLGIIFDCSLLLVTIHTELLQLLCER